MDYNRDKFEQYAAQIGLKDFERNEFDDYCNPFTQGPWNFWRSSRDALPAPAEATQDVAAVPESAVAWTVTGHYTELFSDLEEAHKYAMTIGAKVRPLYERPVVDVSDLRSILACEIECSVFERHVLPALEVAAKVLAEDPQGSYGGAQSATPAQQAVALTDDARDAARYRHLRDCNGGSLIIVQITGMGEDDQVVLTESDADAAIDVALQSHEGDQP